MNIHDWYHALRYRIVHHPHKLHIRHPDLIKGRWYDKDYILLYANFQILTDFVELEIPLFSRWCGIGEKWELRLGKIPFVRWFLETRRNPAEGIAHLEWASKLDDPEQEHPMPSQAHHAREHLALYRWWKEERPARPDPWESITERPEIPLNKLLNDTDALTPEQRVQKEQYFEALRKADEIEESYMEEDTQQLIRLIKVRRGLWT